VATKTKVGSISDVVRHHAEEAYIRPARRRGEESVSIQVGEVHRALGLQNRVPLVCQALESKKFLEASKLRLVSKTGPRSGQSTTVTYTYQFVEGAAPKPSNEDAWLKLRGVLKDIFAELGGGEAYLRDQRDNFYGSATTRESK
jgi:5-methylcytosine-specific restriction protein B